jgi:hypothetical protein
MLSYPDFFGFLFHGLPYVMTFLTAWRIVVGSSSMHLIPPFLTLSFVVHSFCCDEFGRCGASPFKTPFPDLRFLDSILLDSRSTDLPAQPLTRATIVVTWSGALP